MNKKLLFTPLLGIFTLSLLSSCRTEDGAITQKQVEDKRFSVFVPKDGKSVNYADGFALVMKKYDEKKNTNFSGINNNLVIGNLTASTEKNSSIIQNGQSYVEFKVRSEVITEKDGDKWIMFPRVQGTKVKELLVMLLTNKETLVKFFTYNNQTNLFKKYEESFQEALDRYQQQIKRLNLNASIKPMANGDEINIPGVTVPGKSSPGNDLKPGTPGEGSPGMGGDGSVDCFGVEQCIRLGGGGGDGSGDLAPTQADIEQQMKDQPFALVDAPCDVVKKWLATAKHTVAPAQVNKLKSIVETVYNNSSVTFGGMTYERIASVQRIDDAYSAVVNMDYFPVTVDQLPIVNGTRLTPEQFLNYIRTDINNFVDTSYSKFTPYNNYGIDDRALWNSNNPLGSVIKIEIPGDPGSVMVTGYNSDKWTFTTVYEPVYQTHPVSGNRDFGFTRNTNGSYTFYTRGVDRLTKMEGTALHNVSKFFTGSSYPLGQADKLWKSFQEKISYFVNHHSGSASVAKEEIERPDWQKVKDVINGKLPLSTLSKDCKN